MVKGGACLAPSRDAGRRPPIDADEIIARYALTPHPEGGHYREIFRAFAEDGGRGAITSIYYLLRAGEVSAWHRIDAVEIWHYYAGAVLRLELSLDGVDDDEPSSGGETTARGPRSRFLSAPGRVPVPKATGRWSAARWHPLSSSRASSSPHPAGTRDGANPAPRRRPRAAPRRSEPTPRSSCD